MITPKNTSEKREIQTKVSTYYLLRQFLTEAKQT